MTRALQKWSMFAAALLTIATLLTGYSYLARGRNPSSPTLRAAANHGATPTDVASGASSTPQAIAGAQTEATSSALRVTSPQISQPRPAEYEDVINAWQASSLAHELNIEQATDVSNYLTRICAHPHRPINAQSVELFAKSLSQFSQNSGIEFLGDKTDKDGLDVLKFCCYAGWCDRGEGQSDNEGIKQQWQELNASAIECAQNLINRSIPADKLETWRAQIQKVMGESETSATSQITLLNNDFLFPGIKEKITPYAKERLLDDIKHWTILPKYGSPTRTQIISDPDKAFLWQLSLFEKYYAQFFIANVVFTEVYNVALNNVRWKKYNIGSETQTGGWPLKLRLLPPITTQP